MGQRSIYQPQLGEDFLIGYLGIRLQRSALLMCPIARLMETAFVN